MINPIKIANMKALAQYKETLCSKPKLKFLFFELTNACNLCCLHCGSNASPDLCTFLRFDDIKKVLNRTAECYDPKEIMICLSGGEPFLHPDFYNITAYAKSIGFACGVTTNGTLITPQAAKMLYKAGMNSVTISLDGLEQSHNYLRNKPWAFEKVIQGIKNLLAAGSSISVQVTTVINKKNFHEINDIYHLVCSLGVDSWRVINMEPIGRALDNSDMLLSSCQLIYLLDYIKEKRFDINCQIDVTYGCSHYLGLEYENMVRDYYFVCGSGVYVASILCNGDIYSCLDIERRPELIQGNIHQNDFPEVWENRFKPFRIDRSTLNEKCLACEDRYFCRGDAGHTWDYNNNAPLLCIKDIINERKTKNEIRQTF